METVIIKIFVTVACLHALDYFRWIRLWRYPMVNHGNNTQEIPVTVIVAARNEFENLQRLIPQLLQQQYQSFEVIVVLDRTTDESKEWLNQLAGENERLRVLQSENIPEGHSGKKIALTKAIQAARNNWLLFTDADCLPVSNNWIRSFIPLMSHSKHEIILGLSPYQSGQGLLNALIQYETLFTAISYVSAALKGNAYMGVGRNLAYQKTRFLEHHGFQNHIDLQSGDDDLFVQQNSHASNTAVNLNPQGLIESAPKQNWHEYFLQKTRHLSAGKKYQSKLKWKFAARSLIHFTLWLSFLYLITDYSHHVTFISVFCILLFAKGIMFAQIAQKLKFPLSIIHFPITDFLFAILLPLWALASRIVKRIEWKK